MHLAASREPISLWNRFIFRMTSWSSTACNVTSIEVSDVAIRGWECWYLSLLLSSILCLLSADKLVHLTYSLSLLLANLTSLSRCVSSALLCKSIQFSSPTQSLFSIHHSMTCTMTITNQIWSINKLNSLLSATQTTVPTKYGR